MSAQEAANFDDDLTEELDSADEVIEAFSATSDFDSVYGAIARKSMRLAAMLDENPSISKAIRKVAIGLETYARSHRLAPADLDVDVRMTFAGNIVLTIRRP